MTIQPKSSRFTSMNIPTIGDIAVIIEKLKILREKLSDFINEKHKDVSVDKCAHAIAAFPIDESIDPENYIEKLSAEQLLKLLIGCDSSIPTEIEQKIPANEKLSKFLGTHPKQLLEKKLRQSSVVELQRWLNEVIPKLIADSKILSTKKRQLHQIENSVIRELERKEKCKNGTAKIIETINRADLVRRQRKGDWPKDIKQLMNEIEKLLSPYLDYLEEKGTSWKWEQTTIEYLIKVGIPSKLDEVTQELEKIKYKMEVESQQSSPEKPTKTEKKVRSSFKKIIGWIVEVFIALALLVICLCFFGVVTGIFVFAAMLTIFHLLGWLEPIRAFIYNIVSHN